MFDLVFTSVLKRAIGRLWIVLEEMDLVWLPNKPYSSCTCLWYTSVPRLPRSQQTADAGPAIRYPLAKP